jgi:hypothetical protein
MEVVMNISELIARLERIKKDSGDLEVVIRSTYGELDSIGDVYIKNDRVEVWS